MNGRPVRHAGTLSILGIVHGALMLPVSFGVVPLILEVVATAMLQDEQVRDWLALNTVDLLEEG